MFPKQVVQNLNGLTCASRGVGEYFLKGIPKILPLLLRYIFMEVCKTKVSKNNVVSSGRPSTLKAMSL